MFVIRVGRNNISKLQISLVGEQTYEQAKKKTLDIAPSEENCWL